MKECTRSILVVLVFTGTWLLAEAMPRLSRRPPPSTITVSSEDVRVDETDFNRLGITYLVHDAGISNLAVCAFSYAESPNRPYVPTLADGDHATPQEPVANKKRVRFHRPSGLVNQSAARVKVSWIRPAGGVAYSIEKRVNRFSNINREPPKQGEDKKRLGARAVPRLTVNVPTEPLSGSTDLGGTIRNGEVTITIDCGSGPTSIMPTVSSSNFTYTISGSSGQTCLVCVTATNDDGSVTICYEVTFA